MLAAERTGRGVATSRDVQHWVPAAAGVRTMRFRKHPDSSAEASPGGAHVRDRPK